VRALAAASTLVAVVVQAETPCDRAWVRQADAPPQVSWCGRPVLAEQLLTDRAAPLFTNVGAARAAHDEAVIAARRSSLAGALSLMGFGLGLVTLTHALSGLVAALPDSLGAAVGWTTAALAFGGGVLALIVQGFASDAALGHLERAVAALPHSERPSAPNSSSDTDSGQSNATARSSDTTAAR
jgi:hypothetical protein